MPLLPPTVSEITELMKASVVVTFSRRRDRHGAWDPALVKISLRGAPTL
jgi:hypothetical protein